MEKYGLPQEITIEKLVWHNNGVWKRSVVTRQEIPHDFPKLHMDYLEQTIDYHVPENMNDALIAFDGSVTIDRTAGELSSRCNVEGANHLTLNLAHDIVTGKKNVAEARKAFGDAEVEFSLGKEPEIMKALQFKPATGRTADPDKPVVAGSSVRVSGDQSAAEQGTSDEEILGFLIAISENEIESASDAGMKKLTPQVSSFAKMMHEEHGKNLAMTTKLAQAMGLTPRETPAVDKLRIAGAGSLAELVPMEGDEFARGYLAAAVEGHSKVLEMIDNQFLKSASEPKLQGHLKATRAAVGMHLAEAKKLQASLQQ